MLLFLHTHIWCALECDYILSHKVGYQPTSVPTANKLLHMFESMNINHSFNLEFTQLLRV
jgi:hypothetical protein